MPPETTATTEQPVSAESIRQSYEDYRARYEGRQGMTPVPFEDWLQNEHLTERWDALNVTEPAEPVADIPGTETSSQTASGNLQFGNGNQTIINNSPQFVNNPHFEQHIGAAALPAEAPAAPVEASAARPDDEPGERTPPNDELEQVRQRLDEAENQIEQLNQQLEEQRQRYEELERRNQELQQRNEELQRRNEELQRQNEELQRRIEELENPPPPPGPTPEQLAEANTAVGRARDRLAKVDIRRSARITDRFTKRRKEDAAEYDQAMDEYKQALEALAQLMIASERVAGKSDEEIHQGIIRLRYSESERYVNRVVEINDKNFNNLTGWRKRVAMGLRRISDMSTRNKILVGLGLGAGVGVASLMTGGGLAILVAGGAARFSWGLIGHQASLRNVSRHSLEGQVKDIQARRDEALAGGGAGDIDAHGRSVAQETEEERRANTSGNIKRNRRGTAIMAGGLVLTGLGVAHMAGADVIPDASWLHLPFGHHGHNVVPGHGHPQATHPNSPPGAGRPPGVSPWETSPNPMQTQTSMPSLAEMGFKPQSFAGQTPHEAVKNMFDVFRHNNISVRGDNSKAIASIISDMEQHHWHIASGMADHNGHQNIVDVAHDWADGHTQNWQASAEQGLQRVDGSSVGNWQRFMELAQNHGVTFAERTR